MRNPGSIKEKCPIKNDEASSLLTGSSLLSYFYIAENLSDTPDFIGIGVNC
jgi:hypothetical protein